MSVSKPILPGVALVLLTAACDSDPATDPVPRLDGVYKATWQDGRSRAEALVRLTPDPSGIGSSVDGLCRLLVYDGSLGCVGTCPLVSPVVPAASGRTRFTLRSGSNDPADTGNASISFDHVARADGGRLTGNADVRCSFNDGATDRTLNHSQVPFSLDRQANVE